jgi:hypothetical protein
MKLIALSKPRWSSGDDTHTKWNPDVVQGDFPGEADDRSWLTRLVRFRVLGKSPANAYLRLNQRLWNNLPTSVTALRVMRCRDAAAIWTLAAAHAAPHTMDDDAQTRLLPPERCLRAVRPGVAMGREAVVRCGQHRG